jgi:hypothetical protein
MQYRSPESIVPKQAVKTHTMIYLGSRSWTVHMPAVVVFAIAAVALLPPVFFLVSAVGHRTRQRDGYERNAAELY